MVVKLFSDNWIIIGLEPSQAVTNFYNFFLSQNAMTHQGTLRLEVKLGNDHFDLYTVRAPS